MDKLTALRECMTTEGLSALIIPRTDEFQNEYIAPCAERLRWLTGFTGSAGQAIITQDRAALFTDGRYMLQAKEEIPSFYELYNSGKFSPPLWIAENILPSEKVGYDPWLFTEDQLQRYKCLLFPLYPNPLDKLWGDRPSPPQDPLHIHPLIYAGESEESKRKRIGERLKTDHLLLTACDSIAWFLNIRGNDVPHTPLVHSVCLLHRDGSYDLFVDLKKVTKEAYTYFHQGRGQVIDIKELIPHLKKLKGSCQIDPQTAPVILIQTLEKAKIQIHREGDPCVLPKALKNKVEIQGAIDSHIQDGVALCRFFAWLDAQPLQGETTELIAAQKLYDFRKQGQHFKDLSFESISAFGAHGAIIHYHPTQKSDVPLERKGLYLIDSGGQYLTGTTDVTRTLALGSPTPEEKNQYTRVLKGHIAIAQAIFPKDTTGLQLDILARQFLWQVGTDYDHGTGHGVGSYLSVHEGPQRLSKAGPSISLRPGMILSNEPGYYKEGDYGIRLESLVTVVEVPSFENFYSFKTLTLVPFDLKLIENSLLTDSEKSWIQAYHKRIFDTLSPYLDKDTKNWLERTSSFA